MSLEQITVPPLNTEAADSAQIQQWTRALYDRGYFVIEYALPEETVSHFRKRLTAMPPSVGYGSNSLVRLFEHGIDFVALLENQPLLSLMESVLGEDLHIIALQGHRMVRGNEVSKWHADEIYLHRPKDVSDDVSYPPIVNTVNCHYYLVDVPMELGPTQVVPYSHQACRQPRPEDGDPPIWQDNKPVSFTVKAGDCIMYSNQTWHRGSPNQTDEMRLSVVVPYSRRFVAQRFWPFLNYHLARDILDQCTPRQRELLGEHPRGAYG